MKQSLFLCGVLALAAPAFAGELITELVPADARWLAHVDVEALTKSALFQTAREVGGAVEFDEGLGQLSQELGVDPLELVRSITFFSSHADPETGVAAFVVSEKVEELLTKLRDEPSYRTFDVQGKNLLSWGEAGDDPTQEDEAVYAHVRRFEGVSNRLVFISNHQAEVLNAIQVLDGARPSVFEVAERRMSAKPRPNSIVYVETSEAIPGMDGVAQVSAVATLAKGLRFDLGESNGLLGMELVLSAKDARDAQSITSVLQGVSALVSLIGSEHGGEELRGIAQALRFTTNGNQVGVEFQFDSRRLLQTLHHLDQQDDDEDDEGGAK